MVSDGVLLRLWTIALWVVGGWLVALECYCGSGSSGSGSSGTGTTTLIFVVVELTETALIYVEGARLSTGTLRFLGCCELFGDHSFGGFVFESSIEELWCLGTLGNSGVEVCRSRCDGSR